MLARLNPAFVTLRNDTSAKSGRKILLGSDFLISRQPRTEFRRRWSGERLLLTGDGVVEREFPCVKKESGSAKGVFFRVNGISEDGCADVLEVDTDLVGASGMKVAKNQSRFGRMVREHHFVIGNGGLASRWIDHGHFLAVHRMASDVGKDRVFWLGWNTIGDGEIDLFHAVARGKLDG